MASVYRCKKCRTELFDRDSLITCHNESPIPENELVCSGENSCHSKLSSVLFLNEKTIEPWIQEQIDSGEWIKGRLICPTDGCLARLGSFDFVNGKHCPCRQYPLSSIQFIRSKVDEPKNWRN